MKTSSILMIAALIAICSLAHAQTETDGNHVTASIPLKSAINNPGLVHAMYEQLNQEFLNGTMQRVYHVKVIYKRITFDIYGSYDEWTLFFLMDNNVQISLNSQGG